jgi:hypothetical protein
LVEKHKKTEEERYVLPSSLTESTPTFSAHKYPSVLFSLRIPWVLPVPMASRSNHLQPFLSSAPGVLLIHYAIFTTSITDELCLLESTTKAKAKRLAELGIHTVAVSQEFRDVKRDRWGRERREAREREEKHKVRLVTRFPVSFEKFRRSDYLEAFLTF